MQLHNDNNGEYSYIFGEDYKNNFAMTKIFALLSKNAIITFSGCSTADGINNITLDLRVFKFAS